MQHIMKRCLLAIFIAILGTYWFGCTKKSAQSKTDTLVYCSEGSPNAFNGQLVTDGTSGAISQQLYSGLTEFEIESTNVVPGLAESWTVSDDKKIYTFKLRKGVKFHTTKYFTPTRDFNAHDVVFTFKRQDDPNHPYHKVNNGSYNYYQGMGMVDLVVDVVAVNDYEVKFILSRPEAPIIANLAMIFTLAPILSKEYGDQLLSKGTPEKIDFEPIGTGPFKFVSYAKDQMVRFEAHKDYWRGKPKVDKLVFLITPDASVRFQKLKAGECHIIAFPDPANVQAMKEHKDIDLIETVGINVGYLAMNMEKKPLDDLRVRKAIYHSLNRDSYLDAIYSGLARPAKNPMPSNMWGHNDDVKELEFNPEKAKQLLKDAGFEDGFEISLYTLPVSRPYNPNGKKMGEMMQADLEKVGIKVKLVTFDWPTYIKKIGQGEHDMMQLGWTGDNGDPDNFLHFLLNCEAIAGKSNFARYCNKEFDKIVNKAKIVSDKKERTKLYHQAQEIFHRDVPWVPIAHALIFGAAHKSVKNYIVAPYQVPVLWDVYLEN